MYMTAASDTYSTDSVTSTHTFEHSLRMYKFTCNGLPTSETTISSASFDLAGAQSTFN